MMPHTSKGRIQLAILLSLAVHGSAFISVSQFDDLQFGTGGTGHYVWIEKGKIPLERPTPTKGITPTEAVAHTDRLSSNSEVVKGNSESTSLPGEAPSPLLSRRPYLDTVISWVNQKIQYPLSLQQKGIQGRVELLLQITQMGELLNSRVLLSSGYRSLDDWAIRSLALAGPFPSFDPVQMGASQITLRVPIEYRLPQ